MKCLLCKGKGNFLVLKKDNEFDPFLGGTDYYVNEPCPRCKDKKVEKYIPLKHGRMQFLFKSYSDNYRKYFKLTQ